MALMGLLWSADTALSWWRIVSIADYDLASAYVDGTLRVLAIGCAGLFLFRKALFRTAANRRLAWVLVLVLVGIAVCRFSFAFIPENVDLARALEIILYAMAASAGGLLSDDRRLLALGSLYFPVALVVAYYGPAASLAVALVHLVVFGGSAYFWTPTQLAKRQPI